MGSETLKAEHLFEAFLDTSDYKEFQKMLTKFSKEIKEIQHLGAITGLADKSALNKKEPMVISWPDNERVKEAVKN